MFVQHLLAECGSIRGMRQEFAIRFEPASGTHYVPAQNYVQAIAAVLDGLASLRAALASRLASRHKWPAAQVRDALNFSIGPTGKGSLVVPLVPGAVASGTPLETDEIAIEFWREAGEELSRTRRGNAMFLTATAAEAFARASAAANDGHSKLSLASRGTKKDEWRAITALTRLEPYLRKHAERRKTGHKAPIAVSGQITSLTFDPPSFVLATSTGRQTIKMPAQLRQQAREHWGIEVVVDLEATLSEEGDVADPHALAIRKAGTADAALADFDKTFGMFQQAWGTDEAKAYIGSLRLRS